MESFSLPLTLILVSVMLTAAWLLGYYDGYRRGVARGLAEKVTMIFDDYDKEQTDCAPPPETRNHP